MKRADTKSGFTLIEMIISMAIFAIIALSVTESFSTGISSFVAVRAIQRDIESAQFAMNTIAKELRTSTVVYRGADDAIDTPTVAFFDYSQERCFYYEFDGVLGALTARWVSAADILAADPTTEDGWSDCAAYVIGGSMTSLPPVVLTSGYVEGMFYARWSDKNSTPAVLGRLGVYMVVKESAGSAHSTRLQSSVSLRDYSYVGL